MQKSLDSGIKAQAEIQEKLKLQNEFIEASQGFKKWLLPSSMNICSNKAQPAHHFSESTAIGIAERLAPMNDIRFDCWRDLGDGAMTMKAVLDRWDHHEWSPFYWQWVANKDMTDSDADLTWNDVIFTMAETHTNVPSRYHYPENRQHNLQQHRKIMWRIFQIKKFIWCGYKNDYW